MLDNGMGFSLVPWKPVIEQRLGQQLAATVRGSGVSWEVRRQLGPSIGWTDTTGTEPVVDVVGSQL